MMLIKNVAAMKSCRLLCFTWSNGMTGSVIQVTQGGVYQVRFTNLSGCSRTAQVDVPKDPAIHLWNVPSGCYSFCEEAFGTASLSGSTIPFPKWVWLYNNNDVDHGIDTPINDLDLSIYGTDTYQLVLNNGYCDRKSDELHIDVAKECRCELEVAIKGIMPSSVNGICTYNVELSFSNPYSTPLQVTITAPNGEGIFVPSTITIAPGSSSHIVTMIALNGFNGGVVSMSFEALTDKGERCLVMLKEEFRACNRGIRERVNTLGEALDVLVVSPNPASGTVALRYAYATTDASADRTIEIYSLLGVKLESRKIQESASILNVGLERYPAGQYIVVMKENGASLLQKSLILH